MANVNWIKLADDRVEFATNAQSAVQGRISLATVLCKWWGLKSGDPVSIRVQGRAGEVDETVHLTSGYEIIASKGSDL